MTDQTKKFSRNVNKMYIFGFFWMFLVLIPVVVPYFLNLGLSMRNVFELQVILGITVVVCEIPSGYFSDIWGRKKTLIVGALFYAVSFNYLIFADTFLKLIIFEVITGVAISLVSGADMSVLYDSLKFTKTGRGDFTKAIANHQFYKTLAESIAAILGGFLATYAFSYALYAHAAISWIPFVIALTLIEPPIERMDRSQHLKNFKEILKYIFIDHKFVRLIFLNMTLWGVSTFVAVWLFQKYWMDGGVKLFYFGILWAGYNVTVGIVGKWVHFLEKKYGAILLICALSALPIAGYLGLAYFSGWLGITFGLCFQFARGINQVLLRDAFNWRIPDKFRSTANSVSSLFFRLGFALIGPVVGISIDKWGMQLTLIGLAIFFSIFLVLLTVPLIIEVKKQNISEFPPS